MGCRSEQFNSLVWRTLTRYANSPGGRIGSRLDEAERQRVQVLDDGRQKELVASAGEAAGATA